MSEEAWGCEGGLPDEACGLEQLEDQQARIATPPVPAVPPPLVQQLFDPEPVERLERGARAHVLLEPAHGALREPAPVSDETVASRNDGDFGWESLIYPLHYCSSYSRVHVRRERLGFVHRSRAIFCRPAPNLNVTIRTFSPLCGSSPARAG